MMLGKPEHGWSTITIGDFECEASYLTDIPLDFLNSAIAALENNIPFSLYIDEEGSEVYLCFFHGYTYAIREADETELHPLEIGFDELISCFLEDLKTNFTDWVKWMDYELTPSEIEEKKEIMLDKIRQVEYLLADVL